MLNINFKNLINFINYSASYCIISLNSASFVFDPKYKRPKHPIMNPKPIIAVVNRNKLLRF